MGSDEDLIFEQLILTQSKLYRAENGGSYIDLQYLIDPITQTLQDITERLIDPAINYSDLPSSRILLEKVKPQVAKSLRLRYSEYYDDIHPKWINGYDPSEDATIFAGIESAVTYPQRLTGSLQRLARAKDLAEDLLRYKATLQRLRLQQSKLLALSYELVAALHEVERVSVLGFFKNTTDAEPRKIGKGWFDMIMEKRDILYANCTPVRAQALLDLVNRVIQEQPNTEDRYVKFVPVEWESFVQAATELEVEIMLHTKETSDAG